MERTVTITADEKEVTTTLEKLERLAGHRDPVVEQERLFGGYDAPETYELTITGASGMEAPEDLVLGQEVQLQVFGRVVEIVQKVKERKDDGVEYLARVAKIQATSVYVKPGTDR